MTPKEKATQLYDKYFDRTLKLNNAKQCALITVDEIIPIVEGYEDALSASQKSDELTYWQEVKQEIEKL